mgnify:CR=1 FL=1
MKKIILVLLTTLVIFTFFASTPKTVEAKKADPNDPYAFPWCVEHDGCHRFGIANRTDYWMQIYATNLWTGDKGFFSIAPRSKAFLKVQPALYNWTAVYWCDDGRMRQNHWDSAPMNSNYVLGFRCKHGLADVLYRPWSP